MARDHGKALDINKEIDVLLKKVEQLREEARLADPVLAAQSELKRQTVDIKDIEMLQMIEDGKIKQEFAYQMGRIIKDIQDRPFRRDNTGKAKPETRSLTIALSCTPITSLDRDSLLGVAVRDMALQVKVTSSLPKFQSAGSVALIEQTPDGMFKDVRINPTNPDNPRQLEFPGIDEEDIDDIEG
jgi:hypothetical protein